MKATLASFVVGVAIGVLVGARGVLSASQEVVSFVSLLMAGLLPAMILTATVMKGDRFSSARVKDYGEALRKQLAFWALLFLAAIASVFTITAAKMMGTPAGQPAQWLQLAMVAAGMGCVAIIVAHLWSAYEGLRSVLNLTVQMAELQGVANDRTLKDALEEKGHRVSVPTPPEAQWKG